MWASLVRALVVLAALVVAALSIFKITHFRTVVTVVVVALVDHLGSKVRLARRAETLAPMAVVVALVVMTTTP